MAVPIPHDALDLFRVKQTQLEMLRDRGYDVSIEVGWLDYSIDVPAETLRQTLRTFVDYYQPDPSITLREGMSVTYQNGQGDVVYVKYRNEGGNDIKRAIVEEFIVEVIAHQYGHAILITPQKLSGEAITLVSNGTAFKMQHFTESELKFNRTKHFLVPEHIPLTIEDSKKFLIDNKIKAEQMPEIYTTDPIAKYYDAQVGQIMRIIRTTYQPSAIKQYISWRYTVPPPI